MGIVSDLIATVRSTFRIKQATLDASGLTAPRTFTLPDVAGGLVVGPASATDGAFAQYDGTTGKLLKNSVLTDDGAGVLYYTPPFADVIFGAVGSTGGDGAFFQANATGAGFYAGSPDYTKAVRVFQTDTETQFTAIGTPHVFYQDATELGRITTGGNFSALGTVTGSNLSGTNTGDQTITLTGDVTGSGTGSFAATIANDAVTYAKMQNVSATDKLLGRSTAGSGDVEEIACTAAGRALLDDADAAAQRATIGLSTDVIAFVVDGGGAAITTGVKGDITIPFACTITEWTILADQSGSIQFDIWKDTYANFPPVVGDTITASAKPLISAATKGQSSTLTGWTTSIAAGDTLRFNVDSVATCQRVTLSLKVTR